MNKNNRKAKMAAIAILPALGLAAFAGSAFAADATTTVPFRSFMSMVGHRFHDNTTFANNLASVLGLSATDVKAKLDAGQTPSSIITAAGKVPADIMAQLQTVGEANRKAKLAAAVASGKITQVQADTMLAGGFGGGRHGRGLADKTTLAAAVASGKITQAEADAMLARHETNKAKGGNHHGSGRFPGMMGSTNTTR